MSIRDRVLDAFEKIVLGGQVSPSLDAIAATAGVSKGGLLHHFPDRAALIRSLTVRSLERTDESMRAAAAAGTAAETWLRMSALAGPDRDAARALLSLLRLTGAQRVDLPPEVGAGIARWQAMITAELSDPVRGEVVRLVGDGLFVEALTGTEVESGRVDRLVDHLLGPR